jgi:hypothetical protein
MDIGADIGAPIEGIMGIGIITDGDIILPRRLLFICPHRLLFFCPHLRRRHSLGFSLPLTTTATATGDDKGELRPALKLGAFSFSNRIETPLSVQTGKG